MFKFPVVLGAGLFIVLSGCALEGEAPGDGDNDLMLEFPAEIERRMESQENAWNRGDIASFMEEAYWNNESLLFVGKNGLTWGYDATLQRYLDSYPDRAAMGVLNFKNKHWSDLGSRHGLLVGEWLLTRGDSLEDLSGHYSLIWELREEKWFIIADHSS